MCGCSITHPSDGLRHTDGNAQHVTCRPGTHVISEMIGLCDVWQTGPVEKLRISRFGRLVCDVCCLH